MPGNNNSNVIGVVPEENEAEDNQGQQASAMAFHNVGDLFGLSEEQENGGDGGTRAEPELNESQAPFKFPNTAPETDASNNINGYSFPNAIPEDEPAYFTNKDQELEDE